MSFYPSGRRSPDHRRRAAHTRALIPAVLLCSLAIGVPGASAAFTPPTPAQCAKEKGAVCQTVAPAGGNTLVLTLTIGQGVRPDTFFNIWTGVPPTNIRPAGICSARGTGHLEFPETKIVDATYYVTHCVMKIADGHTAQICFDAANGGRYLVTPPPGQYELPFEEPPYVQSSNGAGAPAFVVPAVAGCPLGASKPSSGAGCHVPSLKGRSIAAAEKAIAAGHCSLGRIRRVKSSSAKRSKVISQTPGAGSHPAGTRVNLVVGG